MTKTTLIADDVTSVGAEHAPAAGVESEAAAATELQQAATRKKRSARRTRKWHWIAGATIPVVLLAVWHFATTTGLVPSYQLSTPAAVWEALIDLHQRGELLGHIAISTQRVVLGFTFGAAAGLALGALVGLSPLSRSFLAPTVGALRAVPSLAWVPLLILWLKIGEESKITLIAIGAFFPVYTTLASALRHVDRQLIEVGRTYGLKGFGPVALHLFASRHSPARQRAAPGSGPSLALFGCRRTNCVLGGPRFLTY